MRVKRNLSALGPEHDRAQGAAGERGRRVPADGQRSALVAREHDHDVFRPERGLIRHHGGMDIRIIPSDVIENILHGTEKTFGNDSQSATLLRQELEHRKRLDTNSSKEVVENGKRSKKNKGRKSKQPATGKTAYGANNGIMGNSSRFGERSFNDRAG
jgi:hypothetical protein